MKIEQKYNQRVEAVNSLLCVGLDSQFENLPARFQAKEFPQFAFNRWIIEQTHAYTAAYKPNMAFYEARGSQGWQELVLTLDYLRQNHPEIVTICDAKRGDIGSTSSAYVTAIFDQLGFDAVTLQPYLGQDALQPFLARADKACIILCRTSNAGASEFQNLLVGDKPLWQVVAERVRDEWNKQGNCMLVIGATAPQELRQVRGLVGDMTLLIPGVGAQGGSLEDAVRHGMNSQKRGMIMTVSRSIIFAEQPALAAKNLRDQINALRGAGVT